MNGQVDAKRRAVLRVPLAATAAGPRTAAEAWVDTAFTGGLTLPRAVAAGLGLPLAAGSKAILAAGSLVMLESVESHLDWFGGRRPVRPRGRGNALVTPVAPCCSERCRVSTTGPAARHAG